MINPDHIREYFTMHDLSAQHVEVLALRLKVALQSHFLPLVAAESTIEPGRMIYDLIVRAMSDRYVAFTRIMSSASLVEELTPIFFEGKRMNDLLSLLDPDLRNEVERLIAIPRSAFRDAHQNNYLQMSAEALSFLHGLANSRAERHEKIEVCLVDDGQLDQAKIETVAMFAI